MDSTKMVFSSREGTIQIEGSEAFLNDAVSKLKRKELSDSSASALAKEGVDHAWNWFSLHATQRLQGVNFFLIAAAFLSGAYVSALHFDLRGVAAGVSALGLVFSLAFYMLESRIRELLKAGEAALKPAQRRLAELTGVDEFNISERVERPRYPLTAYSKVFRALFFSAIFACFWGTIYAIHLAIPGLMHFNHAELVLTVLYRTLVVSAGVIVLSFSKKLSLLDKSAMNWLHYVIALGLLGIGIFILIVSVVRPLK